MGNFSNLHEQMSIDLIFIFSVEIVNSIAQTSSFFLLQKPASDGFNLPTVTVNYSAIEGNLY